MFEWMKDKFNKIIGSEEVEETKEAAEEKVDDISETVKDKADELEEKSKEKIDDVSETIEEKTKKISEEVEEKTDELKKTVDKGIEDLKDKEETTEKKMEEFKKEAKEKVSEIKEEADDKLEKISKTSEDKTKETEEKIKVAKEKSKEKVEEISEELEDQTEKLEDETEEPEDEIKEIEKPKDEIKETEEKVGFFDKLKKGLAKTRDNFTNQIDDILKSYKKIDEEMFEELEEVLITADVGMQTTMDLIDNLRDTVKEEKISDPKEVMGLLKQEIVNMMDESIEDNELNLEPLPAVVLVVGVNGVGKTTTIGKMAHSFKQEGKKVLIAAGDTFRAAAIEQLEEWGNRANVDIISHSEGADPAAVIYDGVQAAKARKTDILICDTAGRLHNKSNLMQELNKIFRVLDKEYPEATKEILLVLDATTGQNAMSQAKEFKEVANITGIALTKLDGTAKGGVVLALQSELNIPVKLIGVGEGIDDLQPFDTNDFIEAIFEEK